jgi:xylulokinase
MALANHSAWMGVRPREIRATGGAAANREILQVMADVFDAEVVVVGGHNSAALGAALRAYHADELAGGHDLKWRDVVSGLAEPWPASGVRPIPAHVAAYAELRPIYAACEAYALGAGPDPGERLAAFRKGLGA